MTAPVPPSAPSPELPSARALLRSTIVAVAAAAALLLTVVLPAAMVQNHCLSQRRSNSTLPQCHHQLGRCSVTTGAGSP